MLHLLHFLSVDLDPQPGAAVNVTRAAPSVAASLVAAVEAVGAPVEAASVVATVGTAVAAV